MARPWLNALLVATALALVLPLLLRTWAYRYGFFERRQWAPISSRGHRRTTLGGACLALGAIGGLLAARVSGDAVQAVVVAGAAILVTAFPSERGRVSPQLLLAGRVLAAMIVPLAGVRIETTGFAVVDTALTTAFVLVVISACSALHGTDGLVPVVGLTGGTSALALALLSDQLDVTAVSAALVGTCAGLLVHTSPPSSLLIGRTGGAFVGLALAVAGLSTDPPLPAPASVLVPILLVAVPVVAAAASLAARLRRVTAIDSPTEHLGRRLEAHGLSPLRIVGVVVVASGFCNAMAYLAGAELIRWPIALAAAAVAVLLLVSYAARAPIYEEPATGLPRGLRWVSAGVFLTLGAAVAPAGLALLSSRSLMEDGRAAAQAGLEAAENGDVDDAARLFSEAEAAFSDAHERLTRPWISVGKFVPALGANLRAATAIAKIGVDLSQTGSSLADRAGADSLVVVDGRFPVDASRQIAADLGHAVDVLNASALALDDARNPYLAPQVRVAVEELSAKVTGAIERTATAALAAELAPALFGGDGTRRYFLAILTPSELRGSGGILGSYGEIVASDGDLSLEGVERTTVLNDATDRDRQRQLLPAVFREQYALFQPERFWQNITVSPDFPTTARAIEAAYPAAGGSEVDGVVAVDPIGLAALLGISGSVTVPGWPEAITEDNAPQVLLYDQYVALNGETREDFLSSVADAVFDNLTSGALDAPATLAQTLAPAVRGGHIQLHGARTEEQDLFVRLGAGGELPPDRDDSLLLTSDNGSESKIDWFLHRELVYDVHFDPRTGATSATATITVHNDAPAGGLPDYVIGGDIGGPTGPGENRLFLTVFTPLELETATLDGESVGVTSANEEGRHSYRVLVTVEPGGSRTVTMRLVGTLPPSSVYRLHVGRQPTINTDALTVKLTFPAGFRLSSGEGLGPAGTVSQPLEAPTLLSAVATTTGPVSAMPPMFPNPRGQLLDSSPAVGSRIHQYPFRLGAD